MYICYLRADYKTNLPQQDDQGCNIYFQLYFHVLDTTVLFLFWSEGSDLQVEFLMDDINICENVEGDILYKNLPDS